MEPRIQYVKTSDGVSIAYTLLGSGPTIVSASNTWGNIHQYKYRTGFNWVLDELMAMGWSILTYDGRGSGSSDRDVTDCSLEARQRDLEAVIEKAAPDRFATLAFVQGCPTSIAYSSRNAERVIGMALVNPFAIGREYYRFIPAMRLSQETLQMADDEWEFHLTTLANALAQYSDPERAQRYLEMFHAGMNRDSYVAYRLASMEIDISDLLPRVHVPTLVILDQRATSLANASLARGVAAAIPGARFVETAATAQAIHQFLEENGLRPEPHSLGRAPASGMTAILFADIADSTALTERLGDAAFREKARELDRALRTVIRDHHGTPIEGKLLGDGVLATFASAKEAIVAALACQIEGRHIGLPLHVGLHAGDVIREENNVFGGAVNVAARIAAEAAPGELLVSQTVRDLARTSAGVSFEDRGERELKGVSELVRVFAVRQLE
jgi:class 3 adenylate cyclase